MFDSPLQMWRDAEGFWQRVCVAIAVTWVAFALLAPLVAMTADMF